MNGVDKLGRKISVDKSPAKTLPIGNLAEWSESAVRAFLIRIMKAGGIVPDKGARIMRTSRRSYFRDAHAVAPIESND